MPSPSENQVMPDCDDRKENRNFPAGRSINNNIKPCRPTADIATDSEIQIRSYTTLSGTEITKNEDNETDSVSMTNFPLNNNSFITRNFTTGYESTKKLSSFDKYPSTGRIHFIV